MGQQNRASVDLSDIRERIENARSDPLWKEISMSKKLRILIQEGLKQIESQNKENNSEQASNAHCGLVLDRDHNAALNILELGLRTVGHTGTSNASGDIDKSIGGETPQCKPSRGKRKPK